MDTDQEHIKAQSLYWAGRLDSPDLAQNSTLLTAIRYNPAAIDRAYAMLTDKRAAYGELSTPLRNRVGFFIWSLRLQLEESANDAR